MSGREAQTGEACSFLWTLCEFMSYLTAHQVRDLLWKKLRSDFDTQSAMASEIGVSTPFLNDILHGKREPSGKVVGWLGLERVVLFRKN